MSYESPLLWGRRSNASEDRPCSIELQQRPAPRRRYRATSFHRMTQGRITWDVHRGLALEVSDCRLGGQPFFRKGTMSKPNKKQKEKRFEKMEEQIKGHKRKKQAKLSSESEGTDKGKRKKSFPGATSEQEQGGKP